MLAKSLLTDVAYAIIKSMNGGKNKQPLGYTIVEVLIVLAVSGVMFVIAASFINGKQARTAFLTGTNQFSADTQAVINQVSSGQYSDIPVTCTATVGNVPRISSGNPLLNHQGGNPQCEFVGKAIRISSGNSEQYDIIPLAAARGAADYTQTTAIAGGGVNLITTGNVPQGLTITKLVAHDNNGALVSNPTSIVFAQSLGADDAAARAGSGAQSIGLYYTTAASSSFATGGRVSLLPTAAPAKSAVICLSDGTRFAAVQLGTTQGGSQLSANLAVVPNGAACDN